MNRILPTILALFTGTREQVVIEWSSNSWTHNIFRAWELIFWRKQGIRKEASMHITPLGVKRRFYTVEARIVHYESELRHFLFKEKEYWSLIRHYPRLNLQRGAIGFDTFVDNVSEAGTSNSFNYTCTGSNAFLAYTLVTDRGVTTKPTYNSITMGNERTSAIHPAFSGAYTCYFFGLANPTTGSALALVTTFDSSTPGSTGSATSYSGAAGGFDAATSHIISSATGTPGAQAITTIADNCWALMSYTEFSNSGNMTGGTNATLRDAVTSNIGIADSNAALTPAGSKSQTMTSDASGTWVFLQMSISPTGGGGATTSVPPMFSLLGVGAQ